MVDVDRKAKRLQIATSQRALATAFRVSINTVTRWVARSDWPFGRRNFDVAAVRAWRQQLAGHREGNGRAGPSARYGGHDPLSAAELLLKSERTKKLRLENAFRQLIVEREKGEWIKRDQVRRALTALSDTLRSTGEILQRQFGPDAQEVLNEALASIERSIPEILGSP